MGLVLIGNHNFASPLFSDPSFLLVFLLLMIGHLLDPVDNRLIVNEINTLE